MKVADTDPGKVEVLSPRKEAEELSVQAPGTL
jgi:hypothetical protein